MPRAMSKAQTVLHRVLPPASGMVTFAGPEVDPDIAPEDIPMQTYLLNLSEGAWIDLGQPDAITVTIEPGDRLNGTA